MAFHTYLAHVVSMAKNKPKKIIHEGKWFSSEDNLYEDQDRKDTNALKSARKLNNIAKVVFAILIVFFNLVFWTIALREHNRPANDYIKD